MIECPPQGSGHGGHPWHALEAVEVLDLLGADPSSGLAADEAARRLAVAGPNRIADHRERPLWRLALDQFRSLVVVLLLAAAAVAWALGERVEALAILVALGLNAAIGFGSEWRARVSLARLRALAVPQALVRRGGHVVRVAAAELVPGDLIVLEAGAQVAADARLVRSTALRVTEAALTGESVPVEKDACARLVPDAALAERQTMVYLGTAVVAGSGLAAVTATGLATELGRVGQLVALAGERVTPLERQVEQLGRRLILLALGICGGVGLAGILHGEPVGLMLETAVSLAVAAIPEGLPAVTALALAAGLWRLAGAGALVRRLPAVETLGSTTVICADKTGTMTQNQMAVAAVHLDGRTIRVLGDPRSRSGRFVENGGPLEPSAEPHLIRLLTVGALVNDAAAELAPEGLRLHGDPTEAALLVAALKAGLDPRELAHRWRRRREIPFDPAMRLMATLNEMPGGGKALLVKGAPGVVLDLSHSVETASGARALTDADRQAVLEANRALAREGLRVLAVGWRPDPGAVDEPSADSGAAMTNLGGLTFIGLVGLADPVRPGVREAIARCRAAGIRTIMLTGDQQPTAEAVGRQLGLDPGAIRSRVSPDEKLALIETLQAEGEVVAMTGDGVNDAPALARADIGVAMGGRHGTDVARDAADLVLTDDDFTTIARAVEEGRVIYANLRKVIHFLFSCNLSEILAIFVAILLGFPTPLRPLQILWVNLVTDILPAMALVRDPAEPDVMRRPPRDPQEALVTWRFGGRMLVEGAVLAAGVLSAYLWQVGHGGAGPRATAIAFGAVVLVQPFQAMNCRSDRGGWWRLPPNPLTWLSLITIVGLQWAAGSWMPLARVLGTVPLSVEDWLTVAAAVLWPVAVLEGLKGWRRRGGTGSSKEASHDHRGHQGDQQEPGAPRAGHPADGGGAVTAPGRAGSGAGDLRR